MATGRSTSNKSGFKPTGGCLFLILFGGLFIGGSAWLLPRLGRIDVESARNGDFKAVFAQVMGSEENAASSGGGGSEDESDIFQISLENTATVRSNQAVQAAASEDAPITMSLPPAAPEELPASPPQAEAPGSPPSAQQSAPSVSSTSDAPVLPAEWASKQIRGIYISRYAITNRASEQMIRDRVRFYKAQGINTLIHGVWGNGCSMYPSEVMQQAFGFDSCPNLFEDNWLDWMIDEAHKQGMQVHAYFEKGIKLDQNSPIFDIARRKGWIIPGVDKTYPGIDHYLLDVSNPEIAKYYNDTIREFVTRYPDIDAVQWDDYVGYHEELPGSVDRTADLTAFMLGLQQTMKQANAQVSFDVCHHNPYWGDRYFDADWSNWNVDRAFIQAYNDANFDAELSYVAQHDGIAISDQQFDRLPALASNASVKSVLLFPTNGDPLATAEQFRELWSE